MYRAKGRAADCTGTRTGQPRRPAKTAIFGMERRTIRVAVDAAILDIREAASGDCLMVSVPIPSAGAHYSERPTCYCSEPLTRGMAERRVACGVVAR